MGNTVYHNPHASAIRTAGKGRCIENIDDMSGSTSCPLTPNQEKDKFVGLAQIIPGSRVQKIMETVLAIDGEERLPDLSMRD